jgi:NAD(P)-dependent dehydrogenase (short-subunit alcohol dehydrogenase family)
MIAAQSPDAVVVRGAAGTVGWPLAHAFSNRGAVALLARPEKGLRHRRPDVKKLGKLRHRSYRPVSPMPISWG